MSDLTTFEKNRIASRENLKNDAVLQEAAHAVLERTSMHKYPYNFTWLGLPIVQYPQDIVAIQEVLWQVQPDLVIETGIFRGGSLVLHASLLSLMGGNRRVVGIDINLWKECKARITSHPLAQLITILEGDSTSSEIVDQVQEIARQQTKVLVILDSNHTREHVLKELELYAPLVCPGSYIIVMDTYIADMPDDHFPKRPWGAGNNAKEAVHEFLATHPEFAIDRDIQDKLVITACPDGYLKRC